MEYPPQLITKFTHGQRVVEWLDRSQAVRIRREDSIWALVEDDVKWHESQDLAISKRPDPWNIYKQEFPDGGMNHGSV
ncbi:hypothetical protein [Paeniglutamicibacter sp. NPDC091659]|uniref:hypothetical protein n=1 Tax=Paeniglutamicibacter sp. NPDC091659 TaxID=3364389 RepID=UPI003820FFCD